MRSWAVVIRDGDGIVNKPERRNRTRVSAKGMMSRNGGRTHNKQSKRKRKKRRNSETTVFVTRQIVGCHLDTPAHPTTP